MSKHKSEVLTAKIQLNIKFPEAVITNLRTFPPIFPKIFWTAVWRKTRSCCLSHICKTIYLISRKVAVTVMKCAPHLSSLDCYCSQRNSVGTGRENIVSEGLCIIWKLNVAWPLEKDSVTFLWLLRLLKLKKNSITASWLLKFLTLKKRLRLFLAAFKIINAEKELHHFLTTLKVFNTEKGHRHCLKVFNT